MMHLYVFIFSHQGVKSLILYIRQRSSPKSYTIERGKNSTNRSLHTSCMAQRTNSNIGQPLGKTKPYKSPLLDELVDGIPMKGFL